MSNIKNLLTIAFALFAITANAVTDKIVIKNATVNPGGAAATVTVSLDGTQKYIGYQVEMLLPDGLEASDVAISADAAVPSAIYPSTSKPLTIPGFGTFTMYEYTHSISYSFNVDGNKTLKVSCISNYNEQFVGTSGELFTMKIKASAYAKPGVQDIKVKNCKFAVTSSYYDTFDEAISNAITVADNATASVNVAISEDVKWSTCILPFDAEIPAGFKAYACNETKESSLVLSPVSTMTAYTPYILYSENGCNETLTGTVSASNYPAGGTATAGYITGAVAQTTVNSGYVLQKQSDNVKFYKIDSTKPITVPAGKCWVNVPNASSKASFGIIIGSPTGIDGVQNDDNASAACYNIAGIKMAQPQKGQLYIVNGKKYIAK